ncbi:Uncharacterized protein C132.01c [Taphrina deformans PYCC 5710]|uniref:Ribosome quality control complex subunit 2 n=1 Tax=Taphrina deformans (strain PYCC 5710 / ATCC 11124 / CBS 356.35 / IMI 108563 / JCM 9778 / NBRC 8474) TaxID=1097556 RepID=R4XAJ3_TAPDE|nr:Uncharacterized protein C132.01c [Taphrina deformans PYCC 5710]|eukprot:CCG82527.1 Uncharacterized protein C132.01c [Taphrina deformans PYCC 5710]
MKQRFSSLDLKAITGEINEKLQGTRLANIYDINSRTFLLKFAKQGEKHNVLIESGYRVHLTDYSRETATTPSNFCAKLRKHVRTRRITHAKQLGTDRVLVLTFGGGENNSDPERSYYIILEFYAGGNVILTDGYHKIISLLRVVGEDEGQKVSVGETYDFQRRVVTEFVPISRAKLADVFSSATNSPVANKEEEADDDVPRNALQTKKAKANKKKEKGAGTVKKVLAANLSQYGSALVEHSILEAGLKPTSPVSEISPDSSAFDELLKAFEAADSIVRRCSEITPGYIIAKLEGEHEVYDDFQPFLPRQVSENTSLKTIEFETYNTCVDKFFSSIESQKLEQRIRTQETLAAKRIQASKDEHQKKIDGLVATQETSAKKAASLEGSQGIVDEAINAVNNLLEQGMDWLDIEKLIKTEAKHGNTVAQVIKLPLKLLENKITVNMPDLDELYEDQSDTDSGDETDSTQESESESGSDSESDSTSGEDERGGMNDKTKSKTSAPKVKQEKKVKTLEVDIDLSQTAYANARQYYAVRRTALTKEDKTLQSSKKALRSTQQKIEKDLKKNLNSEKSLMRQIRKVYWFEKFLWFISSEGYLVLGGHDAQQNELLFRRHFRKGDIYVHADLNGASSVIIKNTHADQPIPPSTISQAGTLSVATSQAWDSKMVISAWYVNHEQVSKTAPTGEYLTTGSFMIRGKKNFLPPAKLELGYGMLYVVDEASRDRHVKAKLSSMEEDRKFESEVVKESISTNNTGASLGTQSSDVEEIVSDRKPGERSPESDIEEAATSTGAEQSVADTAEADIQRDVQDPQIKNQPQDDDKYALEEYGHASDTEQGGQFSGKAKHMTAKDRREARKARQTGTVPAQQGTNGEAKEDEDLGTKQQTSAPAAEQQKPKKEKTQPLPQLTRGQKAKKKKMAKYADQDEEDKMLAQKLLGVQIKKDVENAASESENDSAITKEVAPMKKTQPRPPRQNPEVAKLLKEEGITQLDEDEQEQVTPLDIFISQPLPDDVLLEAIPTCGPYAAMARFKYKCKLQPGPTKKGKALRGVVANWISGPLDESSQDKEALWPRERELLKGLKDQELVSPVGVSKVKVSMGKGEVAAKNRNKKKQKQEK